MMCEKKHEVKKGLNQRPEDVAREEFSTGHAPVSALISKL
jgi:hypothetical protein